MYDAIIAGAGPAGLSAAEALAQRGRSVLVLEQNHEIGADFGLKIRDRAKTYVMIFRISTIV